MLSRFLDQLESTANHPSSYALIPLLSYLLDKAITLVMANPLPALRLRLCS